MQGPSSVLSVLKEKSSQKGYVFKDLYRVLFNPEFHLKAYSKLASNQGNMTPGTNRNTIDGFGAARITKLIDALRNESYRPVPVRRTYITKRNSNKKRPLGLPSFDDKVVQEIVKVLLEAMYEDTFSEASHGYRPNRSCHTCLASIKNNGKGTKWWIEGDIRGFFDNIDHAILINILRKRIKDERFLNLIRKFLNAGYMEDWKFHNTYSGTPQGGVLSPVLANIYLNELDTYIESLAESFHKGETRAPNLEYYSLGGMIRYRRKKRSKVSDKDQKNLLLSEIRNMEKQYRSMPSKDNMDASFKRIKYFRYADDFLISGIGSKEDALKIKEQIGDFLAEKLKLELSAEKTLITNSKKSVRFLGYDIKINRSEEVLDTARGKKRQLHGNVLLSMPHDRIRDFMLKNSFMEIKQDGTWKAIHVKKLINYSALEIVRLYNAEITGFYNYYALANDVGRFHNPYFLIHKSFQKTLANKLKTSTKKVRDSFSFDGKLGVKYKVKNDKHKVSFLYRGPFSRKEISEDSDPVDTVPNRMIYFTGTSLEDRILANKCEWCGTEEGEFEVHHVRKLKDLKGKKHWEKFMIARRRKTLVLCKRHHIELHAGKLD